MAAPRAHRGFTLIEFLIALTITSVLAAVAVPGTRSLIAKASTQSNARGLVAAIELARSEAIARGTPVSVCAANAARTGCGTSWSAGWIVFSDLAPLGAVGADDTVIRAFQPVSAPNEVVGTTSTRVLSFAGTGDFVGSGASTMARWTFTHAAFSSTQLGKAVCVNLGTGRARMTDASQSCGST